MNQKARILLKEGRLVTAASSATCGVDLRPEETYLITGKVVAGQASLNLCSYITPWAHLSVRQKKGFRLLYRQGCSCEVRMAEMFFCVWTEPYEGFVDTFVPVQFYAFHSVKIHVEFNNFLMKSFTDDVFLQYPLRHSIVGVEAVFLLGKVSSVFWESVLSHSVNVLKPIIYV
jgi:hypothetical protein